MDFELCLFHSNLQHTLSAVQAGIPSIVIDWECKGKQLRQQNYDTQINAHTLTDLDHVRQSTDAHLICRINQIGSHTPSEVERAIRVGADEILVPMIRTPDEVELVLKIADQKVPIGILIETIDAVDCAKSLSRFPLSRVYVGLNDLAIERKSRNLFLPITDGTIDSLRPYFSCPFGFAGLTLPDLGHPIPCSLIIAELLRLEASFSFLRRSFFKDTTGKNLNLAVENLKAALQKAHSRNFDEIERDRRAFIQKVEELETQHVALL